MPKKLDPAKALKAEIKELGEQIKALRDKQQEAVRKLDLLRGYLPPLKANDRLYEGWRQGRDGH